MLSYLITSENARYKANVRSGFKTYEGESPLIIKTIIKSHIWSPIIWRSGTRLEDHFQSAVYAALDFENPDVSLERIHRLYCDSWHIIGTTRNHQKWKKDQAPCDRFRLLLKWEQPILDLATYRHNIKLLADHHESDLKCVDGARPFFPCTEIIHCETAPDLLLEEVKAAPSVAELELRRERYLQKAAFHNGYGRMSSYAMRWLTQVIPPGDRNNTCLRLGCELYRAGIEFDAAVQKVLGSPTYKGNMLSPSLVNEITRAVSNGYKIARNEKG